MLTKTLEVVTVVAAMPHHVTGKDMIALIKGEGLAMNDDRNQDHLQDDQPACKGPHRHNRFIDPPHP